MVRADLVRELDAVAGMAAAQSDDAQAAVAAGIHANAYLSAVIAMLLVAAMLSGIVMARCTIVTPLRALNLALRDMAEGRLDDVDLSAGGAGEIVGITATVRAFLVQLRQARAQGTAAAAAQAARIAQQTAMDRHTQDFGASISGVMARFAASAGVLQRAAGTMHDGAGRRKRKPPKRPDRRRRRLGSWAAWRVRPVSWRRR